MALRFVVATLAFVGLALACRPAAGAGTQEQQLAQALFDEARALMDRQQFAEACPKFAESQRLDPGGGTLLNLAVCQEKAGKLATAKVAFADALASAIKDGRADRESLARQHLAALEPRIPRITVRPGPNAELPGLEVRLDGLELRREAWDIALPVDPGEHSLQAIARGHVAWTATSTVGPSEKKSIDIPAMEPLAELPESLHGSTFVGGASAPASSAPPSSGEHPPTQSGVFGTSLASSGASTTLTPERANPVFVVAAYTTLASASVSAVTGGVALFAYLRAKSDCLSERDYCSTEASRSTADTATTYAWISTIALGVAAGAAITMIVAPRTKDAPHARSTPTIRVGLGTVGLSGAF